MFPKKQVKSAEQLKQLAVQLYKYQNFRPDAMLEPVKEKVKKECKVDELEYADLTIKNFHAWLRSFIKNGEVPRRRNNKVFFDVIRELQSKCMQPLVPSEDEKARQPRQYNKVKTPVKTIKLAEVEEVTPSNTPTHIEVSQETLNTLANNSKKVNCYGLLFTENINVLGIQKQSKIVKVFSSLDQLTSYAEAYTEKAAYSGEDNNTQFECVKITYSPISEEELVKELS